MKAEILLATQRAMGEYYSDPQLMSECTVEQHITNCISNLVENRVSQKTADIAFLVDRTMKAGTCNFTEERDTGMSSNSIVAIAYGKQKLKNQILPGDFSDLSACRNMWKKLPEHRKTEDAKKAMENAENFRDKK